MTRRLAGLALACLVTASPARALDPALAVTQYARSTWTQEQGLPQNSAQALLQDRAGYLWIGTQLGLVRFDGVRFVVFDATNTPALANPYVNALAESRDGRLLVGTQAGLVVRHGATFRALARPGDKPTNVVNLAPADDGSVWVGGSDGLFRLEGDRLTKQPGFEAPVTALLLDRAGVLWVGGAHGLRRRAPEGESAFDESQTGGTVESLAEGRDGTLWVGAKHGLRRYVGGALVAPAPGVALTDEVWTLHEDRAGSLWIGTHDQGLARLAHGRLSRVTTKDGFPDDFVRALLEDREGDLWVGWESGGLSRLKAGDVVPFGVAEGLPHEVVLTVHEASDGTRWFGTAGGGARGFTKDGRALSLTSGNGLPSDVVVAFHSAPDGSLWIGTSAGLVQSKDARLRAWTPPKTGPLFVVGITQGADGTLYVSTGDGLLELRDGRFRNHTRADGLSADSVLGSYFDKAGQLWVLSTSGVDRRLADGRFAPALSGIDPGTSSSFLEDSRGTIWIGCARGLVRVEAGVARLLTPRQGLFQGAIHRILEDAAGDLWLSGNQGLYRYRRQDLDALASGRTSRVEPRHFARADGMRSPECYGGFQNAGTRGHDGRLWFPTILGAVVVDPARISAASAPPPVTIEALVVDGSALPLGERPPELRDPHQIQIEYAALTLRAPETVRFRYSLEGVDPNWVEAGPRRTAYYTNLPPGGYAFRVAAAQPGGAWSEATPLAFTVPKRFYQGTPFVALSALVLAALALAGHRFRTNLLRGRQGRLENLVRERTEELEQAMLWMRDAVQEAQTLRSATEAISGSLELRQVLQLVLTELRKVVDYDSASVQELEGQTLRIIAGVGFSNPEAIIGLAFDAADPSAPNRDVVRERAPRILADTAGYPLFQTGYNEPAKILSWMGVPMLRGGRFTGMITLDKHAPDFYTEEHARLATTFAAQAAISLENARLLASEREAHERAEQASRAKSAFVASMSHELRTPLNAILGFAQLMQHRDERDAEDREHLAVINRSGEHLLRLINEVLSLAKIESGSMTLNPSDFDPRVLLTALDEMFRPRFAAKALSFAVAVDVALPRLVRGDEGKLQQVLLNLLANALKFTETGGVVVRATWRAGRAAIEVEDSGPGLSADELAALFAAFSQTEAGQRRQEGTGLGLALSRSLARLMDGDVTVSSTPGSGSTFRVELALPAAEGAAEMPATPRRVRGLVPGQPAVSVLVADDDSSSRMLLSRLLSAVGFEVHSVANGQEAIEAWRQERPSLIFMDINMPGLDGPEATRRIREEESTRGLPRTPLVAISASALEHEQEAVMAVGCDAFLAKPFREDVLFAQIAERVGVRYVYDEPRVTPAPTPGLSRERLAALPETWRTRFRAALDDADTDRALDLAGELESVDGPLASELRDRLRAYRLDELAELLGA